MDEKRADTGAPDHSLGEWIVDVIEPETGAITPLVVEASSEEHARELVETQGHQVYSIRPEAPPSVARRCATTFVALFVAAFFIALREVVARAAAGAGLGPLVFVFSELTLGVAIVAIVSIGLTWFPNHPISRVILRSSEHHLTLVGVIAFGLVALGCVSGILYASGILP